MDKHKRKYQLPLSNDAPLEKLLLLLQCLTISFKFDVHKRSQKYYNHRKVQMGPKPTVINSVSFDALNKDDWGEF